MIMNDEDMKKPEPAYKTALKQKKRADSIRNQQLQGQKVTTALSKDDAKT